MAALLPALDPCQSRSSNMGVFVVCWMYSQSHPAVQNVYPGLRRVRKVDELRARALV